LMRMNNKAWQPATVEDLVAFCEDNSNIGSQRDIIALGSVVRRHEYMLGPDDLHLTADNFYSPVAYKMKGSEEKEPKIGITTTRIDGYRSLNGYLGVQDNLYFLVIDVEETTKLELERTRKELDERKRILESLMPNTDTGEK
jgi:hypothetical protein